MSGGKFLLKFFKTELKYLVSVDELIRLITLLI